MADRALRLAHLVSHPVPYHTPVFRELAARRDVDLTVYFYSDASVRGYHDREYGLELRWDAPLLDGYRYRFFPSAPRTSVQSPVGLWPNWDLLQQVLAQKHDAI